MNMEPIDIVDSLESLIETVRKDYHHDNKENMIDALLDAVATIEAIDWEQDDDYL